MKKNKFIIIVPVYNSEEYIEVCLESILKQDYNNYELVVIDDSSTDDTYSIINKVHEKYNKNFNVHKNQKRIGSPLANFVKGIELFSHDKEDIIITVDGDDWLSNNDVLSYLNDVYQDDSIYMTYGQFEPLSKAYSNYCKPIPNIQRYRKSGQWLASHLRTFKNKLWCLINDDDLRDVNGEYYKIGSDTSYMYPLIEMSGHKHIKFIEKVLYIYNDLNPSNDMKIHLKEQLRVIDIIKNKKEYKEIDVS
jgi:glycosyltransferase involved in cell wall biosynthesis